MLCYVTTFRCLSDILITSWLFIARQSTWPGNHLVPCVAELLGFCIPIHAHRCLPDPKCHFYPSGLSLCPSVDHFCLVPVDDMVLFHGMVCGGWLVSYTALPCPGGSGLCTSCERVHFFLVFLQFNVPLDTGQVVFGLLLRVEWSNQQCHSTEGPWLVSQRGQGPIPPAANPIKAGKQPWQRLHAWQ